MKDPAAALHGIVGEADALLRQRLQAVKLEVPAPWSWP
jgi:hypothetical protein